MAGNWAQQDTDRLREAMQNFPPHTNNRIVMVFQAFPNERRDHTLLQHYLEELLDEDVHFQPPQNFGHWSEEEDQ